MNRIAPSSLQLYIANVDGSGERKLLEDSTFDYHATWSPGGKWVVFTSERNGDGQSDIFRCRPDGIGIEPLVFGPSMDDAGALSPDESHLAFVSTSEGYLANIWVLDLETKDLQNLTAGKDVRGVADGPDCSFRPSWSPDGRWIAFSSDRNTSWRGHDDGHGWEHTQELSIYAIRPDGSGFRQVASGPGYCLGSPRWSPDGKRIAFYETTTEEAWGAHRPQSVGRVSSQIVSVDFVTGERVEHTSGPGLKVAPQFLGTGEIAYNVKGDPNEGMALVPSGRRVPSRSMRSPTWSPDGRSVIYEKFAFRPVRPLNKPLYSLDRGGDYRHTDVFPVLSKPGELALTVKQLGNSSIVVMNADDSDRRNIFDPSKNGLDPSVLSRGTAGAFRPAWSPDGEWVTFGLGSWFQGRNRGKSTIVRVRRDGTGVEALTDGSVHSGFPSYSVDGKKILDRVWGEKDMGLRIFNLAGRTTRVLTTEHDNQPFWSPDGRRIVFTRRVTATDFDIFTINPDGTDLRRLTTSGANDAHAVWTADGRILWNTGMYGFRDEAALYDDTFQPYGQIMIMNADGSGKRLLTDSLWKDSMPLYVPTKVGHGVDQD